MNQYFKVTTIFFCLFLFLSITPISALEIEQKQHNYNILGNVVENSVNTSVAADNGNVSAEKQISDNEEEAKKFLKEDPHSIKSNVIYYTFYMMEIVGITLFVLSLVGGLYVNINAPGKPKLGATEQLIANYNTTMSFFNKLKSILTVMGTGGMLLSALSGIVLFA